MLKEDENNEKTKKNKNARGDEENAKNAFVAKMRPANVERRLKTRDADKKKHVGIKSVADNKKRRLADENRQKPADDKKRSTADDKKRSAADDKKRSADVDNNRRTTDDCRQYANVSPPGWDPFQGTGVADRGLATPHALVRRVVRLLVGAVGVNRVDRPGVLTGVTKGSRGVNSTDPSIPSAKCLGFGGEDASRAWLDALAVGFQGTGVVDPGTAAPNVPVPHVVRVMAGAAGKLGIDRPGVPATTSAGGVAGGGVCMTEGVDFKLTK